MALACVRGDVIPDTTRDAATAGPSDTVQTVIVDTIATGLDVPWGIAFASDRRIFVTERVGRIRVIENGTLRPEPWATLPVAARGEAGLMGIAVPPDFATSRELFVVGTFEQSGALVNRVVRLTEDGGAGVEPTVVLDGIPAAVFHAGDAIAFGPDGMLYVGTGDAREPRRAQDDRSLAGKILRLRRDGRPPPDNPLPGTLIYAKGLRNPQGIAWDPATGQAFATDHGPSGFPNELFRQGRDELNVVPPGGNLGWSTVAGQSRDRRFAPPLVDWSSPGIAPSGVAIYTGDFEPWRGSVFVTALKGEQLRRVVVARDNGARAGWRVLSDSPMFEGVFGRLRAAVAGPDGALYFTTSNRDGRGSPRPGDDKLLRLRPRR